MFITFEGIDGSGKTTQIRLLEAYLTSKGREVVVLREPGGSVFSEKIRELVLSNDFQLNPNTELLLFNAARSELTEKVIIPLLKENKVVLCDRYYDSTMAYQGYGRGLLKKNVYNCNHIGSLCVIPNRTYYFRISVEEAIQRRSHLRNDRIENENLDFFKKVVNGFDEIAKNEPERIVVIDATKNIDEIHNQVILNLNWD